MRIAAFFLLAGLVTLPAVAQTKIPRAADGNPDLSGVWWRGNDVGGKPIPGAQPFAGPPGPTFASLYNDAAKAKAAKLVDKDDPTLQCRPTAFGTLNVRMFDVGAVAQIVQSPKFITMLQETYHGYILIPTDGRPHRDNIPPSYRGDSVGKWDGDTFVVDVNNFTDDTWMLAEGRVSHHSDALHIVERYRLVDANTLEIQAHVEDPKVLTKAWDVPAQLLLRAPFDQIMDLICSGVETQELMDVAAEQNAAKK